ncbi:MAG: helix-turn-helix transcriptional regulator [Muribaculaceae bacterium]|nr:helix-turn-helix transcriptional regulator [Muribaculaceae bacterium]
MRIREIISQQGITTKDLADKLGISQSALIEIDIKKGSE